MSKSKSLPIVNWLCIFQVNSCYYERAHKKFIYLLKEEKKFRGTMAAPRSNQALPLILISTFTVTVSVKRLMIFMSRYQSCPLSTVFGRGSVSFKHVKRIYIFFVLLQIMYSMP